MSHQNANLVSDNIAKTGRSKIRIIFDEVQFLQSQGQKIVRLDIGSPNFNAPEIVVRRASDYMRAGRYRYSSNWGLLSLRTALIQNVARMGGPQCDPENEIIITHGASEAVAIVIGSLLNGDEHFLVPTPTWPHYIADCHILNKRYRTIKTTFSTSFKVTPELLKAHITETSKVLFINTPSNPTGSVYSIEEFKALYDVCVARGVLLVLDEIYENLNFESEATLLSAGVDMRHIIYINGFSKSFAMTGFRMGYLMAHQSLMRELIKFHQYINVCGQEFAQEACANFLGSPEEVATYLAYAKGSVEPSYRVMLDYHLHHPHIFTKPSGAFYTFAKCPSRFPDAQAFCLHLLREDGISTVPGEAFGEGFGSYFRISYGSVDAGRLDKALSRICTYYEAD